MSKNEHDENARKFNKFLNLFYKDLINVANKNKYDDKVITMLSNCRKFLKVMKNIDVTLPAYTFNVFCEKHEALITNRDKSLCDQVRKSFSFIGNVFDHIILDDSINELVWNNLDILVIMAKKCK